MAQIAAEEFGISVDKVKIAPTDTESSPYDFGAISSRQTYHCGNAVRLACQDAKRILFERAGRRLGVPADELETKEGVVFVKGMPEKKIRIAELFEGYLPQKFYGEYPIGGEMIGQGTWVQDWAPEDLETGQIDPKLAAEGKRLNTFFTHMTKAVEVAVNTETGETRVSKIGVATDMGQPINPKICEQQEDGGIGMGIGMALQEEVILEDGVVANPNFTDYRINSVGEIPTIDNVKTFHTPAPHSEGPFGAKGIAEGVLIGVDAAIGNALYNAVGVRIKDLPVTAEKVLKALKEKQQI
jgi:carbon-monoxide dehydrogenase large subunit